MLAFTFAYAGFILWKISPQRQTVIAIKPHPNVNLDSVQRDLCALAGAELHYQRLTGHYASLHDLRSDGKLQFTDARWPYLYVLEMPSPDRFTIRAVASETIPNLPSMLTIDDQMQVQTRTKPPHIYPCPVIQSSTSGRKPK